MNVELDFEKRYRLVREVIETIVLTVLMFLIIRMAVQNFNIVGHSMEPNFHDQELVLVDKWSYLFRTPARGDVIVFVAPVAPFPPAPSTKGLDACPVDYRYGPQQSSTTSLSSTASGLDASSILFMFVLPGMFVALSGTTRRRKNR